MKVTKKTARIAGVLYFIVVITGIFSLMYVPGQLIVWEDPAATVGNIRSSEWLFRLGAVSSLVCYTAFLLLPLVLYQLFREVDKTHASMMVVFVVVSVPISFVSILFQFNVLSLLSEADYLSVLDAEQLQAQVMLALQYHSNGLLVSQVFWALWLFPFGYLVYRSGYLPKILGVFLMIGCCGYLVDFLAYSIYPPYGNTNISTILTLPATIGELTICLWLLIRGIKDRPPMATAAIDYLRH
ncbi:hypothetical protein C900_02015 [Fulvivirga imtechensis AK7]|uniref:DUF4386 domain-containing protein n=1 Tax=Fulvivirga imtechensis AK7 TaxID=1237149 RepID=L8JT49_9BACT|nr:DUF4386 domain-containing protein [Fulvivirga imtechensis]ELR72020.1 hypothetical protein C900_02015 [Fulvivirga imtechensis AK7]